MADKKIIDLTEITSQSGTDLYEVSLDGLGSRKETRAQQEAYWAAIFATAFDSANMVYCATNGNNTTGDGSFYNPYADPFKATAESTGTLTTKTMVTATAGTYTLVEYLIRANVGLNGYGQYVTFIDNGSPVELYNDWSGEPAGSVSTISNVALDSGLNLIFNSAPNICAILFDNCFISGNSIASSISGHSATIIANECHFGDIGMTSVNGSFISCDITGDIGLSSSGSGSATSEFTGCLLNSSTDVTISGASGSLQTGVFRVSPIRGTLTMDGIYGRLIIDAASMPYAGITYINGATDSQVTRIGNAGYRTLNNEWNGRNNFTGQIYTAPVAQNSSSNSTAWNLEVAQNATQTMTENTTLANPTNQIAGAYYSFTFTQSATPRTLAFGTAYDFGGVTPVVSTVNGSENIFVFRSNGTDMKCIGATLGV